MIRRSILVLPALAAILTVGAANASNTDTVHAYGISKFGGANECGVPSQSHSAHTLSATSFTDQFVWWNQIQLWGPWVDVYDTAAASDFFTDPARSNVCNCSSENDNAFAGFDHAKVSYVHTHAGHSVAGNRSSFVMGNSGGAYTCNASTDTNFLFGNTSGGGQLEIATMKACEGADYTVWKQGGYKAMVPSTSHTQIYNAFHGDSSCGNFVADYVADYASDSFFDGVGENWIDEAYDTRAPAKTIARSPSSTATRRTLERTCFTTAVFSIESSPTPPRAARHTRTWPAATPPTA